MRKRSDIYLRYVVWGLSGPLIFLNAWILSLLFQFFEQVVTITTIAAILALLLSYPVRWLEKQRLNRILSILFVLTLVLAVFVLLGFTVIPLVLDQATQLLNALPEWLNGASQRLDWFQKLAQQHRLQIDLGQIITQLETTVQTLVSMLPGLAIGTLGRLFDSILVVVLTIYMVLYGPQMWRGLIDLLPAKLGQAFNKSLQFNVQQFFISQVLLALFMLTGLIPIFVLLQVKFALLFALLIGLFELIPFIGATFGILLVTLLTLLQGGWMALWVALSAIALQQIKDNLVAPRLLGQFIGLNPIWIFVSLLVGARIGGVLGVILAIPIAGTIKDTVEQLRTKPIPTLAGKTGTPLSSDSAQT
ncbi:MAG: AI-2E family transporter [Thermosynechococcaceae cyanobacterium]